MRKRRVKWITQRKNGKVYKQPWIGYSYRNKNGVSDFCREVSLKSLPLEIVHQIEAVLKTGNEYIPGKTSVKFLDSIEIGACWCAYCIAEKVGIVDELAVFEDKYRQSIMAMILDRVVQPLPHSKLSLWEYLPGSSIERVIAPDGMDIELHDIYKSLEKLYEEQKGIQRRLFKRNAAGDNMYLYDITSSYFEGDSCELEAFGHNRDGKKGKKQIVIGLLTDSEGCPICIEVFEGNTADQSTVMSKIDDMRKEYDIDEMIFIGDRGMITRARREELKAEEFSAVKYISALKRKEFFDLLADPEHPLQPTLFDRENLVEISFEGTRYVLSFNPEKEMEDRKTRMRLLEKTEEKLEMIKRNVDSGTLKNEQAIAKRLYRWINKWNMGRFFVVEYGTGKFEYERNEVKIKEYEAIDGFYVIISDVDEKTLATENLRAKYKSLSLVEQAFRTLKTTEIFIRPIRHWNPERVKGHVFMCMLAYLIIWEARRIFNSFIIHEPVDEEDISQEDLHSLRSVWETLNKEVKLGKIDINGEIIEQVKPMNRKTKEMLRKAGAMFTPKKIAQLQIVG